MYVRQQWKHQNVDQEQSSKNSLSRLVPKEGTGRAPSHVPDSEEETDNTVSEPLF